jgi:hypothetical protein
MVKETEERRTKNSFACSGQFKVGGPHSRESSRRIKIHFTNNSRIQGGEEGRDCSPKIIPWT